MKKYNINGIEFKTQKQVQDFAKNILYSGSLNEKLKGNSHDFMVEYFKKFHHEWEDKKGIGLLAIKKEKEPMYGKHRAFFIYRVDGTKTDISYVISKIKGRNYKSDFHAGLREVVKPQISEFRASVFAGKSHIVCPITGEKVEYYKSHVDHYDPTFLQIVSRFIKIEGIKKFNQYIAPSTDNQYVNEIIDVNIKNRFYNYHKKVARLRILSPKANLKRKKK